MHWDGLQLRGSRATADAQVQKRRGANPAATKLRQSANYFHRQHTRHPSIAPKLNYKYDRHLGIAGKVHVRLNATGKYGGNNTCDTEAGDLHDLIRRKV